jgi:hypothetical protein
VGTGKVTTDFASGQDGAKCVFIQAEGKIVAGGSAFVNAIGNFDPGPVHGLPPYVDADVCAVLPVARRLEYKWRMGRAAVPRARFLVSDLCLTRRFFGSGRGL